MVILNTITKQYQKHRECTNEMEFCRRTIATNFTNNPKWNTRLVEIYFWFLSNSMFYSIVVIVVAIK